MTAGLQAFYQAVLGTSPNKTGKQAPGDWEDWLRALFPQYVVHPFAERHIDFWEWVWDIEEDSTPRPFVAIWPRGGAKSTSAELASTALGIRGKRRYALYIRETQEQADKSVANIAALLESATVEEYYPEHADRMVGKFGASLGWRRNRLRTSGGFTVDAIGLDTAARGVKVDENRPDLMIFDDIDGKHDTAGTTMKKVKTITTSLLPAGSSNVAVLAIQNLIIPDGVFSQLADGRAEFLSDRIVSGPFPAVADLETEWINDTTTGTRKAKIVAGEATWDGQDLATCQRNIDLFGLSSFLAECQHDVSARKEGLALRFTDEHLCDLTDAEVRDLVKMGSVFGGLDFGAWRFAVNVWAVDRNGIPHCIVEYFSQREEHSVRARALYEKCAAVGITRLTLWGDAANPQDIIEINAAWKRGWQDATTGRWIYPAFRVVAVAMENKMRTASVERLNDLLGRLAIRFRRTLGAGMQWLLGWNAASAGTETTGSRLLWEIKHWSYPIPQEGKAQAQDPDDHTADGGDAVAAMRYAIMSWWKAAKPEPPPDPDVVLSSMHDHTIGQVKDAMKRKQEQQLRRLTAI